jgi:transposase
VAVLGALNEQIATLQGQVEEHFGRHPNAEIILSQPGMGPILGARVCISTQSNRRGCV